MKHIVATLMLVSQLTLPATAQPNWPNHEVNLILPFTAGGGTDIMARIVSEELRGRLGQSFLINNIPGASGNIGTLAAAKAEPDGYTFVVGTISTLAINPIIGQVPFDPEKDFVGVAGLFDTPNMLFVRSGLGINTAADLVAYLKQNPNKLFFGTTGAGSSQYIAAELLQKKTGTTLKQVTYKGSGDIMTALVGGHLDLAFNTAAASIPFLENDAVKVLGVTSERRLPIAPDVPTLSETIDGFVTGAWAGIWAPAATPAEVLQKMATAVQEITTSDKFATEAERLGTVPLTLSGKEFDAFVVSERKKWTEVLRK